MYFFNLYSTDWIPRPKPVVKWVSRRLRRINQPGDPVRGAIEILRSHPLMNPIKLRSCVNITLKSYVRYLIFHDFHIYPPELA